MRNNRPIRLACFILLAALSGAASAADAPASAPAATPSVQVRTVPVKRAPLARTVVAYGTVAAAPGNVTAVNVPYAAHIMRVRVTAGQKVSRGTPLLDVMADPGAVLQADQALSAAHLADGELARVQALYDKQLATQSQLAAARKAASDARQALNTQRQLGASAGTRTINAPFDGVVTQITAAQGDQLQPGAAMLQLAREGGAAASQANVALGVQAADALQLRAGDTVRLQSLALDAQPDVAGRVVSVGGAIDPTTRLVNVGISAAVQGTALIPGTLVKGTIAAATVVSWVVPRSAVLTDEKGDYLFQVAQDKARRVEVRRLVEQGDQYGVDGPLNASLPVVASGNYELAEGMKVATGSASR